LYVNGFFCKENSICPLALLDGSFFTLVAKQLMSIIKHLDACSEGGKGMNPQVKQELFKKVLFRMFYKLEFL
jgi:hypothetical protein